MQNVYVQTSISYVKAWLRFDVVVITLFTLSIVLLLLLLLSSLFVLLTCRKTSESLYERRSKSNANRFLFITLSFKSTQIVHHKKVLGCCISSRRYIKIFVLQPLFYICRSVIYKACALLYRLRSSFLSLLFICFFLEPSNGLSSRQKFTFSTPPSFCR